MTRRRPRPELSNRDRRADGAPTSATVLLSGVTGCRNRGVEALVRAVAGVVAEQGMGLIVSTSDPDYDRRVLSPDATVVGDAAPYFRNHPVWRVRGDLARVDRRVDAETSAVRDAVDRADVVLATGGDVFTSDYGAAFAARHMRFLRAATRRGRPTGVLLQSIGPFRTVEERRRFVDLVATLGHVSVRESASYRYLCDDLGIDPAAVTLGADPAFLLAPEHQPALAPLTATDGGPVVSCSPSQGISSFAGLDRSGHLDAWVRVVRHLVDVIGARVVIVAHVSDSRTKNDDQLLAGEILRTVDRPGVGAAFGPWTAAELKGVIATCDMHVGERMHSNIAALSSGVPAVCVGYSVKTVGIVTDLVGPSTTEQLVTTAEELGTATFTAMLDDVWARRACLSAQLVPAAAGAAELARATIGQALDLAGAGMEVRCPTST